MLKILERSLIAFMATWAAVFALSPWFLESHENELTSAGVAAVIALAASLLVFLAGLIGRRVGGEKSGSLVTPPVSDLPPPPELDHDDEVEVVAEMPAAQDLAGDEVASSAPARRRRGSSPMLQDFSGRSRESSDLGFRERFDLHASAGHRWGVREVAAGEQRLKTFLPVLLHDWGSDNPDLEWTAFGPGSRFADRPGG